MRILIATWEGGGHVPPALLVARRLAARGAEVLVVSDEATRPAAAGLGFAAWTRAPNRLHGGSADDPLRDWKAATPVGVVRAVCDTVMCRPALDYALDAGELIERFDPDVVVANELMFGVMAAAEARRLPLALLTGNLWCFPTRSDLPPFGPAFPPARTEFQRRREAIARGWIARLYDLGLRDLNRARAALGLAPLAACLDQLAAARRILIGTAAAFDFGQVPPPAPFAYVGPLAPPPAWTDDSLPDDLAGALTDDGRPLVLASFSTTFQDEARTAQRCLDALGRLPVRGILTRGPALADTPLSAPANVTVVDRASHDLIVPRCDAVICHGGHGTVIRPLVHGVPVVVIPVGRDQPENAVRIAERGAGLVLPRRASAGRIRAALTRVLEEPGFRHAAARLGAAIAEETDGGLKAAEAIEALAR